MSFLPGSRYIGPMPYEQHAREVSFVTLVGGAGTDTLALQLAFTELAGTVRWTTGTLSIEGAVPLADRALELKPEKGVAGAVQAVGEIEVDDPAVDAAWVIRGDDAALLVHMLPELRALADLAPHVSVAQGAVRVSFAKLDDANAKRALEGALAVWHRVAFFRLA